MLAPNPFVYQRTYETDIKSATIPSILEEHYGQCGEDLIIFSILRALQTQGYIGDWVDYTYVEIGANHAFAGSNTFLLHKCTGITGILVEANPALLSDLKKARSHDQIVHVAITNKDSEEAELFISHHHELSSLNKGFVENWHNGYVGIKNSIKIPTLRPNRLLADYIPPDKKILLLSIDIEGKDLDVVKDIDFTYWRPLVVQLEPSEHYAPGESIRMTEFMQEQNYILLSQTNVNLIFFDKHLLEKFFSL